jgi:hypothetical protein
MGPLESLKTFIITGANVWSMKQEIGNRGIQLLKSTWTGWHSFRQFKIKWLD